MAGLSTLQHKNMQGIAISFLLIIFIIDVITPPTFIVDALYLTCILLVFQQNAKTIMTFSIVVCALISINIFLLTDADQVSISIYLNRLVSIFSILVTSFIAVYYTRINEKMIFKEEKRLKDMEQMLFLTSHKLRKPVANIIGLIGVINNDTEQLTQEDLIERSNHLLSSALELDQFLNELNQYIEQSI